MGRKDGKQPKRKASSLKAFFSQPEPDVLILVLGVTGAGKSTFVNDVLGDVKAQVSDSIVPLATSVQPYTTQVPAESLCKHHRNSRLVLVDTPGFDGTQMQDSDIFERIQSWLRKSYGSDAKFSGIIYLHDISEKRIRHTTYLNLDRLKVLCGENPRAKLVMATTHWDEVLREDGIARENELRTSFWRDLLNAEDSNMMRIEKETKSQDVWRAIEFILDVTPAPARRVEVGVEEGKSDKWKRLLRPEEELFTDAKPDDIIIAVMGSTGVGKSTFINTAASIASDPGEPIHELSPVGHGLESCTRYVAHYTLQLPSSNPYFPNRRLVLVDTPGFDDTHQDDTEVLRRISAWLAHSYSENARLAGLVYIGSIQQKRVFGSERLNLAVFRKLCGKDFSRIIMCTTHWDCVPSREVALQRELELKREYWNKLIDQGAQVHRMEDQRRDAESIVNTILASMAKDLAPQAQILQIQAELVDMEKTIPLTEAGTKLRHNLREILDLYRETLTRATDEDRAEWERLLNAVACQVDQLNVPVSDKVKSWFRKNVASGLGK